jgi:hypothetical protein
VNRIERSGLYRRLPLSLTCPRRCGLRYGSERSMKKFGRASFPSPIIYSCSPNATPSDVGYTNVRRITGVVHGAFESSQTKGEVILDLVVRRIINGVGFGLLYPRVVLFNDTSTSRSARGSTKHRTILQCGTQNGAAAPSVVCSSSCSATDPQTRTSPWVSRRSRCLSDSVAGRLKSEEVGGLTSVRILVMILPGHLANTQHAPFLFASARIDELLFSSQFSS